MTIPKNRIDVYNALLCVGFSKEVAAKISWAGKTKAGRKRMARKASRTRKSNIRRGRR